MTNEERQRFRFAVADEVAVLRACNLMLRSSPTISTRVEVEAIRANSQRVLRGLLATLRPGRSKRDSKPKTKTK
jgi:hypothetical protein